MMRTLLTRRRARGLPGPRGAPGIGTMLALRSDPLGFLTRAAEDHGEIVDLGVPLRLHVGVFGTAVRDLLVGLRDAIQELPARAQPPDARGVGVVTSTGEAHARHREIVHRALQPRFLDDYLQLAARAFRGGVARWAAGARIDLVVELERMALSVATHVLFGVAPEHDPELATALSDLARIQRSLLDSVGSTVLPLDVPPWLHGGRWRRARAVIAERLDRLRRAKPVPAALAAVLAEVGDAAWTADELRDNVLQVFLAGNDTVTTAVMWTLFLLAGHPEIQRRAAGELAQLGPEGALAWPALDALPWLDVVVKEGLRLYPTSPFGVRHAVRDVELGGFVLPAGTVLIYSPWVNHRQARYFPAPLAFRPERFLAGATLERGAYIPFALGASSCLGPALAQLEIKAMLAVALRGRRLVAVPDQTVGIACALFGSLRHVRPCPALWVTCSTEGDA